MKNFFDSSIHTLEFEPPDGSSQASFCGAFLNPGGIRARAPQAYLAEIGSSELYYYDSSELRIRVSYKELYQDSLTFTMPPVYFKDDQYAMVQEITSGLTFNFALREVNTHNVEVQVSTD